MFMAMGHERSKALHNFDLPCGLKWGHQKFLRCSKVDQSAGDASPVHRASYDQRRAGVHVVVDRSNGQVLSRGGGGGGGGGDGIAAVREKLMFDLQAEAVKMKDAIFRENDGVFRSPATATGSMADASRPWNLRTRRAAYKSSAAPANEVPGGSSLKIDVVKNNGSGVVSPPPLRTDNNNNNSNNKSPRLRSGFAAGTGAGNGCSAGEKRDRERFSVSISRKEIEEDFMAMIGHRPPRRPKKRPKFVQKNLDTLFPGLWLTEITPDLYKVADDQ